MSHDVIVVVMIDVIAVVMVTVNVVMINLSSPGAKPRNFSEPGLVG